MKLSDKKKKVAKKMNKDIVEGDYSEHMGPHDKFSEKDEKKEKRTRKEKATRDNVT